MTLQARMSSGDQRLYNPGRDVAHNFQEVMNITAGWLEDKTWPELAGVLDREGVTMDDLGEACACYCTYVASAADEEKRKLPMHEALRESGFFACKPAAQVAVLASIGTCYAGIAFGGIREATVGGDGPLEMIAEVAEHADRLRKYMGLPRWRRRLFRFRDRMRRMFQAFRS